MKHNEASETITENHDKVSSLNILHDRTGKEGGKDLSHWNLVAQMF